MIPQAMKLNAMQVESILDKLVPLVASKQDAGFFRGVIGIQLEAMSSADAAVFVGRILREGAERGAGAVSRG